MRYNSSDDNPHPIAHPHGGTLDLTLRRPVPGDVEARLAIGRHAEIVRAYGHSFDPAEGFTREHAERSIAFLIDQPYAWVIDVRGFIGHVRFHSVDGHDRRAALAIGIEDPARLGRGLGTEALRLALGFGFAAGLHRVSVRVLASNARAIACYRKCGFVEEGREREAAFVEGGWQDDLIMGLLDREFAASPNGCNPPTAADFHMIKGGRSRP